MTSDFQPVPAAFLDGGSMDCGSGLLLLITRALRAVPLDGLLLLRTEERSVVDDLPAWARLAGHQLQDLPTGGAEGPWQVGIRRGSAPPPSAKAPVPSSQIGYSDGVDVPLGTRLWLYTNFDCNLACDYCCARSSPAADKRRLTVELAAAAMTEFKELGGSQVLLTGGEPFLHPELDAIVAAVPTGVSVTILTNAMVVSRGARRATLERLDRERVVLQVSLDSADEVLHDQHRGAGSHARALAGIGLLRELGFRVKVAATVRNSSPWATAGLHDRLDDLGIPIADRLIRPVAAQGFADDGVPVTLDDLVPEPTLTVDGAWWHPVAVTDPAMRVADHPLPLSEVLAVIRDTVAVQDQARAEGRRHVFRCT